MSHNAECESDDIAVREKAAVDALEKQVLEDLSEMQFQAGGQHVRKFCCPRAKWAVLSFP